MNEIRVSCAALAQIKIDNKYLLLMNKRSLGQNKIIYTPVGGALEYLPNGKKFLDNLNVKYERQTPDLRLRMDKDNLELFDFWFSKGIDRERDVFRELKEEMVDEESIIKSLSESDVEIKFIRTEKPVIDIDGLTNHFFYEIYSVEFSDDKLKEINEYIKSQGDVKKVVTLSKEQIENDDFEFEIGSNCISIL